MLGIAEMVDDMEEGAMTRSNRGILKRKGFRRFTAVFMAGVLLAGNLPVYADTEAAEPVCGLTEHVHTEACYTAVEPVSLNCASADAHLQSIHKHTESCYDKEGRLICGYADFVLHTHADSCYNSQGQLICQIPENKGHQHTDACYADVDVLVCQEAERPAVPGHQHTEACYTWVNTGNLICGQAERAEDPGHTHTEACYTLVNTGNLICGQNERAADPGHQHTEACYTWVNTGNLICGQAERAADLGHSHNEACYDGAGNLICGQAERGADPGHVHTEDCYEHVQQLTCGQEERAADPGHTHTEDCYEHVQQLSCGQEKSAGDPGHVHTASCYQKQRILVCGQPESSMPHVHSEACYEKDENGNLTNILICGKAEVYEHVHSEACIPQTEYVLTCGMEEHQHTETCYLQMVENEVQQETELTETELTAPKMEASSETELVKQTESEQEAEQEETEYKAKMKQMRAPANNETEQTTGIYLDTTSVSMSPGNITGLNAYYEPSGDGAEVDWSSSDESIVSFHHYGGNYAAITANAEGMAVITATTKNGAFSAVCEVTVTAPTGIYLDSSSVSMSPGNTISISAFYEPLRDGAEVDWSSSDESIAAVQTYGENSAEITASAEGTAVITATTKDGAYSATCEVIVSAPTGIYLGSSSVSMSPGNTTSLCGYYAPAGDYILTSDAEWSSSDESIVSFQYYGDNYVEIIANAEGTAVITATTKDGAYSATCEVTVTAPTGIYLDYSSSVSMSPGNTISVRAYYEPSGDGAEVNWVSSDEGIISVLAEGGGYAEITANAEGTTVITATTKDGAYSASFEITVSAPTGIRLGYTSLSMSLGNTISVWAYYEPSGDGAEVNWTSSDEGIISLLAYGGGYAEIAANAKGTTVITATTKDGAYSASCEVTVSAVTGIYISSTSIDMSVGNAYALSAFYAPTDEWVSDSDWSSSDESIVSVKGGANGELIANAEGTAVITATTKDGVYSATCEVTVYAVTGIRLGCSTSIMSPGHSTRIYAYSEPMGNMVSDVDWNSSDESIISVNVDEGENAEIIANAEGTAVITATTKDGSYSATWEMDVCVPTGIRLSPAALDIMQGQSVSLDAYYAPTDERVTEADWSSSNENIVMVHADEAGNAEVTALAAGTAVITAATKDGVYSAVCEVTVIMPTGLNLSSSSLSIALGSSRTISALLEPLICNDLCQGQLNKNHHKLILL